MVNMLLSETTLPFAYPCRSTWPHCNTVYCRWGRYGTTEITNTNSIAATRVSQGSHTLYKNQGNGLSVEKQGNFREFTKQLREILKIAKSQAILREWLWQILVLLLTILRSFFHMFCLLFPDKTSGKISHSLIHQGLIYVTYIYPWWIGEWPAYN